MMKNSDTFDTFENMVRPIIDKLSEIYWMPMAEFIADNPQLIKTIPGFLITPEKIILYLGETHLGIEYTGSERIDTVPDDWKINIRFVDLSQYGDKLLEKVIGFDFNDSTSNVSLPIPAFSEGLVIPTNKGADKLEELRWRFEAQDSVLVLNSGSPLLLENEFTRIVNGLFFDANENGLHTRHIKWIDFIPVQIQESNDQGELLRIDLNPYKQLAQHDCEYVYPVPEDYDYKHSKLQKINRFLELAGNNGSTEPQITRFLAQPENQFILSMRFGATSIHDEVTCEWQSEDKKPIRPDFFIVMPDGFANIVEFKLPTTTIDVTGRENRETFSAQINSYISQTRTYRNYFDDPNNRKWFESRYEFSVYRPRRYLVIGRRWEVDRDTWREIVTDHPDLEIITYDDLVDGVVAQLYRQ